jgi:hypothetical protein
VQPGIHAPEPRSHLVWNRQRAGSVSLSRAADASLPREKESGPAVSVVPSLYLIGSVMGEEQEAAAASHQKHIQKPIGYTLEFCYPDKRHIVILKENYV